MSDDFSKNLVKDYKYWGVYVFDNQCYLGRCVVWCKREDALDLADASKEEREELFAILNDLRKAVSDSFQADWMNYAFLGDDARHLHCHFVPRYKSPRTFMNLEFKDKLWGHHYRTDKSFITPKSVLKGIRDELKKKLK